MNRSPVLVIEDDDDIRALVVSELEWTGYPVVSAENGLVALRVLDQCSPRLILLDLRMPVMNGWDFATRARNDGILTPIVVMSAESVNTAWARNYRVVAQLAKPFEPADLLAIVERYGLPERPGAFV